MRPRNAHLQMNLHVHKTACKDVVREGSVQLRMRAIRTCDLPEVITRQRMQPGSVQAKHRYYTRKVSRVQSTWS